jgi:hypothetical protein
MLNVIVLNVIMPNAIMLNAIMLNAIMLNAIMLNVIMLNVIMLNVIMLNVIMLNVIMLNVIMLNVVTLDVAALKNLPFFYRNVLVLGLTLEACVNETCAFKLPIFNNSEIPGKTKFINTCLSPFVSVFVYSPVHLSIQMSVCFPGCLSVYLPTNLVCTCSSFGLSVHMFPRRSVSLSDRP